ncbi:ATP-dependent helicase HrpB [Pseudoalteromonas 'SMAR']|uniref:ATP-dependent helicase HrpB n=1 Tax=Pseudoalteromonas 'SMAR' TaxID=3416908 RepID=UPI003AF262DE
MLPIEEFIPQIHAILSESNRLVLQAEPGAGKSTVVPLRLLQSNLGDGKKIIMLEPRRVAAKSIATYLAQQLGEQVGEQVGYQIRNERKCSAQTRLEIVTEGVLTRRLQADPELPDVGLIIFDEFHERSIHADLALMLTFEVQQAYREDLKLLVMSATIDSEQISEYLAGAQCLACPGRAYPVAVEYRPATEHFLAEQVSSALRYALSLADHGDILVFLPGQGEIKRCIAACERVVNADIRLLPLYGGLPLAEQEKVFRRRKGAGRRVIFATNIAETSLTIDGITMVIDSGLEKRLNFDVKSGLSRLQTAMISKASATQRAGRAGRLQPGHCVRLWRESEQQRLSDFQTEEIVTTELTNLTLELSAWGITQYHDGHWLTPPPKQHYVVATELNQALGLVDIHNKILPMGNRALSLAVEPRLASMMLQAKSSTEKQLACWLAALLSERDVTLNASGSDLIERLLLVREYSEKKSTASSHMLHRGSAEQVLKLAKSFAAKLAVNHSITSIPLAEMQLAAAELLLHAYPDRVAQKRPSNDNRYLLANGRGVTLREGDALQGSAFLVVCDVDGKNKDGTVFLSCAISQESLLTQLRPHLQRTTHYRLDDKKESIVGREQVKYQALILQQQNLSSIPNSEFQACVRDILTSEGLDMLNWTAKSKAWLARAKWLGSQLETFPAITEATLIAELDTWLLPYLNNVSSLKQLKQVDIFNLLQALLDWPQQQLLEQQAPEFYLTPSNKRIAIRYDAHQGPTVAVVLQEMFGELEAVMLANGQVPVRFELLSPAQRPIQTTSDLANFWRTSYYDVAKDMRGRYPKHRWPDNPLVEKPGRSMKAKH